MEKNEIIIELKELEKAHSITLSFDKFPDIESWDYIESDDSIDVMTFNEYKTLVSKFEGCDSNNIAYDIMRLIKKL